MWKILAWIIFFCVISAILFCFFIRVPNIEKDGIVTFKIDAIEYDIQTGRYRVSFSGVSGECWVNVGRLGSPIVTARPFPGRANWGGSTNTFGPNRRHLAELQNEGLDLAQWVLIEIGKEYIVKIGESLPVWYAEMDDGTIETVYVVVSESDDDGL